MTILAYANPADVQDETQRGDGHGIVRFDQTDRATTFECWPRFVSVKDGDSVQYPGWPITVPMRDNDGRSVVATLPEIRIENADSAVFQVIDTKSNDVLYTVRSDGPAFRPPVYSDGPFDVRIGRDRPDGKTLHGLKATDNAPTISVRL